jgi:hypothetical protein
VWSRDFLFGKEQKTRFASNGLSELTTGVGSIVVDHCVVNPLAKYVNSNLVADALLGTRRVVSGQAQPPVHVYALCYSRWACPLLGVV